MLDCVEHTPGRPVRGSVIWLHGLGANGYDFVPLVPHLDLRDVRFVFPHAPEQPVTVNDGHVMPAWYDIRTLDFAETDREDPGGVRQACEWVRELIAREVERGVPEEHIVLAGFSQGAAVALYTALRHPRPLAGVIVLSGYLVLEDSLAAEVTPAGRRLKVFFAHGNQDEVVPVEGGREALRRVGALGVDAEWREWPMGHELNADEVEAIRTFLHARFR